MNDIGASYKMAYNIKSRVNATVNLNDFRLIALTTEIQKRFGHSGYLSLAYNEGLKPESRSLSIMFRYSLPYMQTHASTSIRKNRFSATQGVNGSIAYDRKYKYAHYNTHPVVGKGGFTIIPYLDVNHNNIKDEEEVILDNLNVRIQGARILRNQKDKLIRVSGLELYTTYIVKLDDRGFENIAWQVKNKAIEVYTDPNQFKVLEVPVKPMGEISGFVYFDNNKIVRGVGRVPVSIYSTSGNLIKQIKTEPDGYYNYLGLAPGEYFVKIEETFLKKHKLECAPMQLKFEILKDEFGAYVDGLDLLIHYEEAPTKRVI